MTVARLGRPVQRPRAAGPVFPVLNAALVAAIVLLDWLTPAGIVVGIFLGIPIIATSATDSPRLTWLTFAVAMTGFVVAALYGRAPISPAEVWIPNRVFALLTLPASCGLALHLQRRRREAERARDEARAASEINRLLVSLVAHDLRAPLATAVQALDYARATSTPTESGDPDLLRDVQVRLRRNLASIDGILRFFRDEAGTETETARVPLPVDVGRVLEAEIDAFREESAAQGKPIRVSMADDVRGEHPVDLLVLRQAVGILLDNAMRHARPGPIEVAARIVRQRLHLAVTDSGPVQLAEEDAAPPRGSGVGLALCRALVARAGGSVDVITTEGNRTRSVLALPLAGRER